jgi:hypothetical protein
VAAASIRHAKKNNLGIGILAWRLEIAVGYLPLAISGFASGSASLRLPPR